MECRKIDSEGLAESYLQGLLDPAAQDDFEVHILECAKCRETVELLQVVRKDLDERAQQVRGQASHQPVRLWWRWAAAGAVAMVVSSMGVIGLSGIWRKHELLGKTQPPSSQVGHIAHTANSQVQDLAESAKPTQTTHDQLPTPTRSVSPLLAKPRSTGQEAAVHGPFASRYPEGHRLQAPSHSPPVPPAPPAKPALPTTTSSEGGGVEQPRMDNLPINGRIYMNFMPPPSDPLLLHDNAPDIGTAATSNQTPREIELYFLGKVQVPPYTFSGFGSSKGNLPRGGSNTAASNHNALVRPSDARRPFFQNAMLAYLDGKYDRAADLLERDLTMEPYVADANFYFGICKLLLGRPQDSVEPLKTALKQNSTLSQSAHFYLAKAYVQMNDLAKAESEMQAAADIAGRLTTEARSLLERIQTLRTTNNKQ